MNEALEELEEDRVVLESLGAMAPDFVQLKRQEWKDYHRQVSAWEVERYLTLF